jgi:hypothetical protein
MSDYPHFRPLFAAAIDPRFYTIDHLDHLVLSKRAQCWFGEEAAIVTEVRTYPSGATAVHGLVAAGRLEEIVDVLIPMAEAWGRAIGCTLAVIESRGGWARQLKDHGYAPFQTAVAKELGRKPGAARSG